MHTSLITQNVTTNESIKHGVNHKSPFSTSVCGNCLGERERNGKRLKSGGVGIEKVWLMKVVVWGLRGLVESGGVEIEIVCEFLEDCHFKSLFDFK